ncbi:hypothetical protein YTPLAS18_17190 [Nitrospira sp.]|nr:hypothetical protein YTPLAS18_17190 [Nitrospira sp.]
METATQSRAHVSTRKSLRAFKKTPQYRAMLTSAIERRETSAMSDREKRRVRLDRITARLELDALERGENPSEFHGLLALLDPLHGLLPDEVYE